MPDDQLQRHLQELETLLHRGDVRVDPNRLAEHLHEDFVEIGRSGRRYTRAEILQESAGNRSFPLIRALDFEMFKLCDDAVILSYRTAHEDAAGTRHRHTLRASVWIRNGESWRMIFHQGTPAGAA